MIDPSHEGYILSIRELRLCMYEDDWALTWKLYTFYQRITIMFVRRSLTPHMKAIYFLSENYDYVCTKIIGPSHESYILSIRELRLCMYEDHCPLTWKLYTFYQRITIMYVRRSLSPHMKAIYFLLENYDYVCTKIIEPSHESYILSIRELRLCMYEDHWPLTWKLYIF
jgi:hypothetical protein